MRRNPGIKVQTYKDLYTVLAQSDGHRSQIPKSGKANALRETVIFRDVHETGDKCGL